MIGDAILWTVLNELESEALVIDTPDEGSREHAKRLMRIKAQLEELDVIWPEKGDRHECPHQKAWEEWARLQTRWEVLNRPKTPPPTPEEWAKLAAPWEEPAERWPDE